MRLADRVRACVLLTAALAVSAAAWPIRPEVVARHGVVAAGRSHTADAGAQVLAAGGNAVDAGVAAVFAAAVVEISHFGLGGEAPILIYSARTREVVVINGQGPAPRAAGPALFAGAASIPGNGPLGATIPAVVDAAALALSRFGTRALGDVLAPAIELADGFPMYPFLQHYLEAERANCEPYPDTMRAYYPEGRVPRVGEAFRQPDLARTLRVLVEAERTALAGGASREAAIEAGRDAFYRGDIARRIVSSNRHAGGVFSEADLAEYRGRVERPYSMAYRDVEVFKAGPWNQSPALLQTLALLNGVDLAGMGAQSVDALHTTVEAVKLAYADRDRYYGDPEFVRVPMRGLLSPAYTTQRRALIDPERASLEQRPGDPWAFEGDAPTDRPLDRPGRVAAARPPGTAETQPDALRRAADTTAIEVADAEGNLFSATPSSGWLLGGAFVAGDTGVPLSNRMQAFRLDPASPNVLAGGKRPRTTLTPTIVLRDGRPFLAIGTPGGDNQDQQILLVLLNLVDFRMGLQAAIEAPRVNSLHFESSFGEHRFEPGVLEVEASLPAAVQDGLRARGHVLRVRPAWGISTGVVAAGFDPATGSLRGGADPRRERHLVAW
jgi:gamma-glutamyltranspeptidase/glutathione hydrolase